MAHPPLIVRTLPSLRRALDALRVKKATIALVPTMGALHEATYRWCAKRDGAQPG